MTLVVDISASMYRFNSYDGRLERLLEATLMIMEALGDDERFRLQIVGHNGMSARIPLMQVDTPKDPKEQLRVLEEMVAYTRKWTRMRLASFYNILNSPIGACTEYTWAGDSTLEAIESAIQQAKEGELVLIISDANLRRYHIEPEEVARSLSRRDVHAHLVLIGSMGEEAVDLANAIPNKRAQVCNHSEDLPLLMKNIVESVVR